MVWRWENNTYFGKINRPAPTHRLPARLLLPCFAEKRGSAAFLFCWIDAISSLRCTRSNVTGQCGLWHEGPLAGKHFPGANLMLQILSPGKYTGGRRPHNKRDWESLVVLQADPVGRSTSLARQKSTVPPIHLFLLPVNPLSHGSLAEDPLPVSTDIQWHGYLRPRPFVRKVMHAWQHLWTPFSVRF